MKNFSKTYYLLVICLIFLSGCASRSEKAESVQKEEPVELQGDEKELFNKADSLPDSLTSRKQTKVYQQRAKQILEDLNDMSSVLNTKKLNNDFSQTLYQQIENYFANERIYIKEDNETTTIDARYFGEHLLEFKRLRYAKLAEQTNDSTYAVSVRCIVHIDGEKTNLEEADFLVSDAKKDFGGKVETTKEIKLLGLR